MRTLRQWRRLGLGWWRLNAVGVCPHCRGDAGHECPVCQGMSRTLHVYPGQAREIRPAHLGTVWERYCVLLKVEG